jgi:hypothetical protein
MTGAAALSDLLKSIKSFVAHGLRWRDGISENGDLRSQIIEIQYCR